METTQLHSNHLFHFKKDINILKLILKGGFQHRRWQETIPFFGLTQTNFMVCFTDLRAQDSVHHRQCYGKNALVMTKAWARKNKVSPVRYIHKDSAGMDESYMHLKNLFRNAMMHKNPFHKMVSYLATSEMYLDGKLPQGDIKLGETFGKDLIDEFEENCKKSEGLLSSSETTYSSFLSMFKIINKLHDELELRDAFLRTYIDDFTCPSSEEKTLGKILYDEREWRSIIFPHQNNIDTDPNLTRCIKDGFLPEQYNIKFSDEDIIAILVETEEQKTDIIKLIRTDQTLLDPLGSIEVLRFDEYDKDHLQPSDKTEFVGNIQRIKLNNSQT